MKLSHKDQAQLEWLGRQEKLVWGAHIDRGTAPNADIVRWLEAGLIGVGGKRRLDGSWLRGYYLTQYGRQVVGGKTHTTIM
jgi:hypothetical protein